MTETQTIIIDCAADCCIKKFMQAWFEGKVSVLVVSGEATDEDLNEAFERIQLEYIDLSGLAESTELDMNVNIHHLNTRINAIKAMLYIQREFLQQFGLPLIPGLPDFKRYSHVIYWDFKRPDAEAFLKRLRQIELKESRFIAELDKCIKELIEFKEKQKKGEVTITQSRKQFVRNMNTLNRAGFNVDKDKTSVEEYALMLKDYKEEVTQQENKK